MSVGSSFRHCGAWTANNQDFIEPLLGFPHSEGVATRLALIEPSEWFDRVLDVGWASANHSTVGKYKCREWVSSSHRCPVQDAEEWYSVTQCIFSKSTFLVHRFSVLRVQSRKSEEMSTYFSRNSHFRESSNTKMLLKF